jgi:hypothetical protein
MFRVLAVGKAYSSDDIGDGPGSRSSNILVNEIKTNPLYKEINKIAKLGGNGHGGAIYGEVTRMSMIYILRSAKEHLGLSKTTTFLDIGSGVGKPNLTAAVAEHVRLSIGIEVIRYRHWMSQVVLDFLLKDSLSFSFF